MGFSELPRFSKSHSHDSSSHGSPVDPNTRTVSRGFPVVFDFSDLTNVGERPSSVTFPAFIASQNLSQVG